MADNNGAGVMLTRENGGVQYMAELQVVHGLAIEIVTGMKTSRGVSWVKNGQARGMISEKTRAKQKALREAVAYMQDKYENWDPKPSVQKALEADKPATRR